VKVVRRVLLAVAALIVAGGTPADAYPDRPVRLIVTLEGAGASGTVARIVGQKLSDDLGKQFYVDSQAGAGGNIGMGIAAKSAPDGHTILFAVSTLMVNPSLYASVPYDPIKDFAPVTLVGVSHFMLLVHPSVPAKDARELVALIKANPGKYNYASPGVGTTPHLLGEMLRVVFGLDLVHVPFKGGGSAISSTLAGDTPIIFATPAIAGQYVKQGALRALAVTNKIRLPALPDVPTVSEVGLPGEDADTIVGMLVPAGTPRGIIDLLQREIAKIVAMPDVQERFAAMGIEPVADTPEEFGTHIKEEIARWDRVIRDANLKDK
jgi:tripartite-type tricarboxylate transporter receptor subunit TctC